MLTRLLTGLGELLAPSLCPACELPTGDASAPLCAACLPLLEAAPASLLPPHASAAAYVFEGPMADAIRRFKYDGRPELGAPLGELLAGACRPFAGGVERVVPMPLHPRKLRARGYNPAALLARPVASALCAALDFDLLQRARDTASQASLPRSARTDNVRGAFTARAPGGGARVLLVDDVRTTGATSSEAARALCEAGYRVTTVALAWSPVVTDLSAARSL